MTNHAPSLTNLLETNFSAFSLRDDTNAGGGDVSPVIDPDLTRPLVGL